MNEACADVAAPRERADAGAIELTEKAAEHILETMAAEGAEGQGLRIAVVQGGCSGHEYALSFAAAAAAAAGDRTYEIRGLRVFVAGDSLDKIAGTVLDYEDGLYGAGLKFRNPRAARECGCGASFSTA